MILIRYFLTFTVLSMCVAGSQVCADDYTFPSTLTLEQVRQQIDRCQVDHPRLLANGAELAALKERVQTEPLCAAVAKAVVHQADLMMSVPPIKHEKQGRRLLGQSRQCVKHLLTLAMAFHLTNDQKYVSRAEKEMLVVADFADWNPSHFLDVAEMTFAMAIGYDWFYHELSDASRAKIRQAIVEKGVALPFTTRYNGWVRATNNWGQVCHGGLTAGALAVLEDEPELAAKTVHNALQNVRYSMAAYAPKGSYPEGPGYWVYGTSYNVLLIGELESALGSDFGLTKAPGFSLTGQYPALVCGPSGLYFNYADGGSSRGTDAALFWFAKRFSRPDWLLGEYDLLESTLAAINRSSSANYGSRLFPMILLWMKPPAGDMKIEMPLNWSSEGHVPITIHRSSWTDPNATFVGFKGGSPSANHGNMDIGSFVLDADGERWGMDLGAEGYNGIESRGMNLWDRSQDSDRWTIFRQSNLGHNTLVIDGKLQRAAGFGKVVAFSDRPAFPHSVIDMSDVYRGQAGSVQRGIGLYPSREIVVQDQLTGLAPGASVRWGMITPATAKIEGNTVRLTQAGKEMTLQILAPTTATWKEVDTATPRHEWDSPNRHTRMVAFECAAPQSGDLSFTVLATPGSCSDSVAGELKTVPLEQWGK